MADLLLLGIKALAKTNLAVQEESSKEAFTESSNSQQGSKTTKWVFWSLYMVIVVMIGSFAAYLSWTSNSLVYGNSAAHLLLKVLFAMFAFFFGLTYLFMYMIFRWDLVSKLSELSKGYPYAAFSSPAAPSSAPSPSLASYTAQARMTPAAVPNTRTSLFSTPKNASAVATPGAPNAAYRASNTSRI